LDAENQGRDVLMYLQKQRGRSRREELGCTAARIIDRAVHRSHKGASRLHSHPYFVSMDAALVLAVLLAAVVGSRRGGPSAALALALATTVVFCFPLYPAFLIFKGWATGSRARSALLDTIGFLLPCHLMLSCALGQPLARDLEYLGLALPIMIGTVRLGCFCSGCCYGRPARWGVLYQPELLMERRNWWRTYTPGPAPGCRVFPIQLLDAAFNYLMFAVLAAFTLTTRAPATQSLALYFLGYSGFRLLTDSLRGHRHRPVYGGLSEAQWLSVAIGLVSLGSLLRLNS
jgi:hypothetical protein